MPDYDQERQKTARKWAGNNRVACMLLLGFPIVVLSSTPLGIICGNASPNKFRRRGCSSWKKSQASGWARYNGAALAEPLTTRLAAVKDLQWKNWKSGKG